jgi:hypothetical protein
LWKLYLDRVALKANIAGNLGQGSTTEKTILRIFSSREFSHSLDPKRTLRRAEPETSEIGLCDN